MPTPMQLYKPGQKIVGELNNRLVPVGFKATPQEAVTEWVKPREDHYGTDTTLSAEKFAQLQETEAGMAGRATSPWGDTFSPTSQLYKERELSSYLIEALPRPDPPTTSTTPTTPTTPTTTADPSTTSPTTTTTSSTTPTAAAPPQQVVSTAVTPTDTPTFGQTSPLIAAQQSRTRQRSRRRRRPTREADSFLGGGQTLGAG